MNTDAVIFVAGGNGLVGSAIIRRLQSEGYSQILSPSSSELDLTNQSAVSAYFAEHRPEYVFDAAAKVGGILANQTYPVDFLLTNLKIQNTLIEQSHNHGVKKLLFLGSSCIYPKHAPQPLKEEYLLTDSLEPTNEWYAIAKIAGIKLCEAYHQQYGDSFISAMPTNLYGPGDNFHPQNSHVIPGMMRRFHEAKQQGLDSVTVWGSGTPMREFLFVDDLADALVYLMKNYNQKEFVNVGTGVDVTIRELAETMKEVVVFEGSIEWDTTKPDGTPRKLMDVSRLESLGWKYTVELKDGLQKTYQWFLDTVDSEELRSK